MLGSSLTALALLTPPLPVSPWEEPASVDEAAPLANERAPEPPAMAPERRGTGLLAVGGTLMALAAGARIAGTALTFQYLLCYDEHGCDDAALVATLAMGLVSDGGALPVLVLSTGLIAGGLVHRGRWQAREDARTGKRRPAWTTRRNIRLGFGLLGAGAGVLAISTSVGLWARLNERSDALVLGVHEGGFFVAGGLIGAGMALGPFALGYEQATTQIRVAPTLSSQGAGLTLSGRF